MKGAMHENKAQKSQKPPAAARVVFCLRNILLKKKTKTFRIDVVQHHRHTAYALGSNIEKEKKWHKKIASNRRETKNNPKHVRMPRRKL